MPDFTPSQWLLIALAVVAWIIPAVRVSRMASQYGRSPRRWFFITLLASALPALVVFWRDYIKTLSARESLGGFGGQADQDAPAETTRREGDDLASGRRCEHCGEILPAELHAGQALCPTCRMKRHEERLA
jgi:hypothetical protein